jgi:hypothetical protein
MRTRAWLFLLLLGTGAAAAQAADWQVVILKSRGCNTCVLLEEVLKRSGQLQRANLNDGAGGQITAPILRRASTELSEQEWSELRALPYFGDLQWQQRIGNGAAMVLLKRDGVIAAAGDIADSVDARNARFPQNLNLPDVGKDPSAVRNERMNFLSELSVQTWNLDWFYRLALQPTLLQARHSGWLTSPDVLAPPLAAANVFLMSTASGAVDNEIFNALRIEEIRDVLSKSLSQDPDKLRIFYGGGSSLGANALEVRGGRMGLVRRSVPAANPLTPDAVRRIFQSIRARPASRNLLVLIGHGGPEGAGMWGTPTALSPTTLQALHAHGGGDDVLVSGNCFGGVMARAMSCGFFGARPDIIATGCQADAAEVAQSRDYLHTFFTSLTPEARATADADGNGDISFAEAHWYASIHGDARNVTYTSVDALADEWAAAHPEGVPRSLTVREIQALAKDAPAAEAHALKQLASQYNVDLNVPLGNLAEQAQRWVPEGILPRTQLAQLTRRVLYLKATRDAPAELTRLQACEGRSIATFLSP